MKQIIDIPAPNNPLPWTQKDEASAIRDANGQVVSLVNNVPFLMGVVKQYQSPFVAAQLDAQLSASKDSIRNLVADLERANKRIGLLEESQAKTEPSTEAA